MSGTTITRRIRAARRPKRTYVFGLALVLQCVLGVTLLLTVFADSTQPNLSSNATSVTCATAQLIAKDFGQAVQAAQKSPPDYSAIKNFGFSAPLNPSDIAPLQHTLEARLTQVETKAKAVEHGSCTDHPTASIVDADGTTKVLPVVDGHQPMTPVDGSDVNRDPRTVPVTVGTSHDGDRTDSWSELDTLYGNTKWYTDCANKHLAMDWGRDVPKYTATEGNHDNRFIVALNVSSELSDEQIRRQAAADGNPNTDNLKVVRYEAIIDTRNLDNNRCDEFIHTRSQIRVSLGKVIFDDKGNFKELDTTQGSFVDCHNLWHLPKSSPKPSPTPGPSQPPTEITTPPGTPPTTAPPTNPPTTKPPKCIPPEFENEEGNCIVPKKPEQGAGDQNGVPEQVEGPNLPAPPKTEPRPADPPDKYVPPPPPANNNPGDGGGNNPPPPPRTQAPPPVAPAPPAADPGTKAPCAPGITEC